MGGGQSKSDSESTDDLFSRVNAIATEYIINDSFQNRLHLAEEKNCQNLLDITAKALEQNLSAEQIRGMSRRLSSGGAPDAEPYAEPGAGPYAEPYAEPDVEPVVKSETAHSDVTKTEVTEA